MIKGVSRTVIEINDTDNKYFEKALFYVRPEFCECSTNLLQTKAKKYINGVDFVENCTLSYLERSRLRHRRLLLILGGYLLLLATAITLIVAF